ncbi:MAG: oligoendopeptidase F [Candidatus Kapaibacterium sp.]
MNKFKGISLVLLISILLPFMAKSQSELPTRADIQDKYKWDLKDMYKSRADWEVDFQKCKAMLPGYDEYIGKLGNSAGELYKAVKFNEDVEILYSKLAFYAFSSRDTDLNNGEYQSMFDKVMSLGAEISAASSYIVPEILENDESRIMGFIKTDDKLLVYRHKFEDLFRGREHMLSADQEKLLAKLSPISQVPGNTYGILNDAELPFPQIQDEEGRMITISHGRFRAGMYSNDRDYRIRLYKGAYQPYDKLKNTLSSLYNGRVKTRMINADIRGYNSALEAALDQNNIPVGVYENLVKVVKDNAKTLHRWAAIKKRVLGVDELHPYDTYVSLFPGVQKEYTFDEAKKIMLEVHKPLGDEYLEALNKCFDNRWIDVYETKGKRSGAYSNSCACGFHPVILLNWNNTLDDLFILAHELGHNMHSYFTEKYQPYPYANYSIFVAEVASITNETLLLDYLIENAETKEEKLALIEKFLVNAQTTFFRQTRFAEFEKITHEKAEKGEFLNADQLSEIFGELYGEYWGPDMVVDYEESLSWSRIPHIFKYNFYVFQYSTGFAAAQAFSKKFKDEGKPAIDAYLNNFIHAGSSDYPINVLKNAGVDMSTPTAIEATVATMNDYLDQMEALLNE